MDNATVIARFLSWVKADPDRIFLDTASDSVTFSEVDARSSAVAVGLTRNGVGPGDRVGVALQNTPEFVYAVLGCWRMGAVVVPVNPMYRERELLHVVQDSAMSALLADLALAPVVEALNARGVRLPTWFGEGNAPYRLNRLFDLLHDNAGRKFEPYPWKLDDVALLTYTSGTTGRSKGAMNTHSNLAYQGTALPRILGLDPERDAILSLAPMFHITGLVLHLVTAVGSGCRLVLTGRFVPAGVAALIERRKPTFTIGATTAFISLLRDSEARKRDLSSLTKVLTGGAPVPPSVVEELEAVFGFYVHNAYGLTETTAAVTTVPLGVRAPVDPVTGSLSVGKTMPEVEAVILNDDGTPLPDGEIGELALRGPQVSAGYWMNPDATAAAFIDGRFATGDVALRDADGWIYIVDRKKDMIIASGYKIWPREVEDVLYEHPAVKEAAVVGVHDDYRGETIHAFVSIKEGADVSAEALQAHCREKLAAYKCPTEIKFLLDLPKTVTGKIIRRELRSG